MWPYFWRATRLTKQAAKAATEFNEKRAVALKLGLEVCITNEKYSTYEKRRDDLRSLRRTLMSAKEIAEDSDSEDAEDVLELVEEA